MPPNVDAVRYRLARTTDAASIAALHADSWQHAYRGIFPDSFLDNDVFANRASEWHKRFNSPDEGIETITVLAELDSELVGFAHSIVDEDAEWGTLLDNLHVRHDAQRLGIGRQLMYETVAWLEESGSTSGLYLWVLTPNTRARRFYETLGGQPSNDGISHDGDVSVPMLRISWPRLEQLLLNLPKGPSRLLENLAP